jgi:hypothetical protein
MGAILLTRATIGGCPREGSSCEEAGEREAMGYVKRRSGNWQATVRGPDGRERTSTFARKVDADNWIATSEADQVRGTWVDPVLGRQTVESYAKQWQGLQSHRRTTISADVSRGPQRRVRPFCPGLDAWS